MRRLLDLQGLQAFVAADAVIDVDHEVAGRERRRLGQEVLRPPAPARPRQPVAQDVGLGDDRQVVGLEPRLQRQHHPLRPFRIRRLGRLPIGGEGDVLQPVVGQHYPQPLGRALRPGGEQHLLAGGDLLAGVVGGGLEQVDAVLRALGREGAPTARAEVYDVLALLAQEGGEPSHRPAGQPLLPLGRAEVEAVRTQRRDSSDRRLGGLVPRLEGVGDHRPALVPRLSGQVIERDQRILRQIVEQAGQMLVDQRQEVLQPAAPRALADRGVERIIARRAEGGDVAAPEARDRLGVEQHLGDRQQVDRLELSGRALGLRIEGADRFQAVAEQVQPHRLLRRRREDVDHPAADGELAALGHRRGAAIAVHREVQLQFGDVHVLAGARQISRAFHRLARRRALHQRRRLGDQQPGRLVRFAAEPAAPGSPCAAAATPGDGPDAGRRAGSPTRGWPAPPGRARRRPWRP